MARRLIRLFILVSLPFALLFIVFLVNKRRLNLALLEAAHESQPEIVASLLDRGANVNARDSHGDTPLHEAALAVQALGGNTPEADLYNRKTLILLISHGGNVNAQNIDGDIPLHYAVMAQNLVAIRILIQMGARMNIKSKRFGTPLRQAEQELICVSRTRREGEPVARKIVEILKSNQSRP